jgi:mRNA interferase YafQ
MYDLVYTKSFRKSLKKYKNDIYIIDEIKDVLHLLQTGDLLPAKYKEHYLKGKYLGFTECHILPDLLMVFNRIKSREIIVLYDIGSHANLFK